MGLYMYVTDIDRVSKRAVLDPAMNELFQEALQLDSSLMIETTWVLKRERRWWGIRLTGESGYNIYHETPAYDGSPYQARLQASGSGRKDKVVAYLHGIINGVNHFKAYINK